MSDDDTMTAPAPDVDNTLRYVDTNRKRCRCRIRIWHEKRFVLVTELDDNPGMSVTNAVETVAAAAEEIVGAMCGVSSAESGYRLVEHYPATSHRADSFDMVIFTSRTDSGPARPSWRPLAPEHAWLVEAVSDTR